MQNRTNTRILYKRYSPEEYPAYDNYDAINVDKAAEIPMDWDGAMGVPPVRVKYTDRLKTRGRKHIVIYYYIILLYYSLIRTSGRRRRCRRPRTNSDSLSCKRHAWAWHGWRRRRGQEIYSSILL